MCHYFLFIRNLSLQQRRYFFLFVCWEKQLPVSQLNVISQRCVTVATWAGRGGVLMQCAVSSAQPRVAARLPIRLRQQSPVYARTWRRTSNGGGLLDFLCALPLFRAFISPPHRLYILWLCLRNRDFSSGTRRHEFAESGTCFTFSSLSFLLDSRRGSTPRGRAASSALMAAPPLTPPPTASSDR